MGVFSIPPDVTKPIILSNDEINAELNILNGIITKALHPVVVFISIMFTISISGNTLVCVIFMSRMKRGTQTILISSLSIVDLVGCAADIPFDVLDLTYHFTFKWSSFCKATRFLKMMALITSTQILVAIALDRYMKVCRPFKKQLKALSAHVIVASSLCVSVLFACPIIFIFDSVPVDTGFPGVVGRVCTHWKNKATLGYYIVIGCVMAGYASTLAFLYGSVGWATTMRRNKFQVTSSSSGSYTDNTKSNIYDILFTDKASAIGFSISLVFLLSFMPVLTLRLVSLVITSFPNPRNKSSYAAYNILIRSYLFNSCSNPFIYGLLNDEFKKEIFLLKDECMKRLIPVKNRAVSIAQSIKKSGIQLTRTQPKPHGNPYNRTVDVYQSNTMSDTTENGPQRF